MSRDRIRYLLADEVGLGKTIEAGLILRELKLRGMVRRILIAAPKGLIRQAFPQRLCRTSVTLGGVLARRSAFSASSLSWSNIFVSSRAA